MRFLRVAALAATISCLFGSAARADELLHEVSKCRGVADSLARLTCYDRLKIGTPAVASQPVPGASSPVTMTSYDLRLQPKDYRKEVFNERVELVPTLHNATKKTVIGVVLALTITDAFGDTIVDGSSKLDIRIPPGQTVESETFYFWDDNPFINNEVYDKLSGPVGTGAAKASAKVTRAVYSDGSSESF